jgi:16S rRNA processing protein RimM
VAERICVAQIGPAHGTRGEVRLKSFTRRPDGGHGLWGARNRGRNCDVRDRVLAARQDHWVAQLRGVRDRNAAERLANTKLFVPRDRLPAAETDEFYHADLIGLAAVTTDGRQLGTVVAIHDFGAGDILELRQEGKRDTVMLPFTSATVPVVDIAGRRIVIDPPDGVFKD